MNTCLVRTPVDVDDCSLRKLDGLFEKTNLIQDEYDFVKNDYKVYIADLLLCCSPIIMFGMVFVFSMLL